jgi:2,3-bisphosphoglycerate-independent phosphoglycerate mutase
VDVPGATGDADTDYRAKAEHALRALDDVDVVLLHVAAADECGHRGDAPEKVRVLERLDGDVVAPVLDGLRARGGEWRVMALSGHATPCGRRTHTADPVPFVVYAAAHEQRAAAGKRGFCERDAREYGIFVPEGHGLLDRLLRV